MVAQLRMLGDALSGVSEYTINRHCPISDRLRQRHRFRSRGIRRVNRYLSYAHGSSATALRAAIRPVHMHSQLLPPPLYIQPQKEPNSPAL